MIFGADVSHETSTSESIAAVSQQPRQRSSFEIISTYLSLSRWKVVGSLDKECISYAARLYAQSSPRGKAYEMIHDLDKMVKSLIQEFFSINHTFPKRIVFYRDGVSDGQFGLVSISQTAVIENSSIIKHLFRCLEGLETRNYQDQKSLSGFTFRLSARNHIRCCPEAPSD